MGETGDLGGSEKGLALVEAFVVTGGLALSVKGDGLAARPAMLRVGRPEVVVVSLLNWDMWGGR